ncbi:hypothetical protein TNCV_3733381 [Trichonephila clavipes]|nr:hypothetical protein TNCV_3733381 [Trichonephila clavipes]
MNSRRVNYADGTNQRAVLEFTSLVSESFFGPQLISTLFDPGALLDELVQLHPFPEPYTQLARDSLVLSFSGGNSFNPWRDKFWNRG